MTGPLDFLSAPPTPVRQTEGPFSEDVLCQSVADNLLELDGVDGAWIERDPAGERVVVLHYSRADTPSHLPGAVAGMAVKVVGGEPIRALS
jgi:hypothetical protein